VSHLVMMVGTWFVKSVVWEMVLFAMIEALLLTIMIALFKSSIPISREGRGRGSRGGGRIGQVKG